MPGATSSSTRPSSGWGRESTSLSAVRPCRASARLSCPRASSSARRRGRGCLEVAVAVRSSLGPAIHAAWAVGGVVFFPHESALEVNGLSAEPLPTTTLRAARRLLDFLEHRQPREPRRTRTETSHDHRGDQRRLRQGANRHRPVHQHAAQLGEVRRCRSHHRRGLHLGRRTRRRQTGKHVPCRPDGCLRAHLLGARRRRLRDDLRHPQRDRGEAADVGAPRSGPHARRPRGVEPSPAPGSPRRRGDRHDRCRGRDRLVDH